MRKSRLPGSYTPHKRNSARFSKSIFIAPILLGITFVFMGWMFFPVYGVTSSQWKGHVEIINDVKTVQNPIEPLFGELKIEIADDLRIGRSDDDNYLFNRVQDLAVDEEGNIFVLDMGNYRVQKFDKNGKHIKTIGRKGQGPGEFDVPRRICLDKRTGNIAVQDQAYFIELFSADGIPIKNIRLDLPCSDFRILPSGLFAAISERRTNNEAFQSICLIDQKGKVTKKIVEFPYTIYMRKRGDSKLSIRTGHELALHFNIIGENSFLYGYSNKYELYVSDFEGHARSRIVQDAPLPVFTEDEKNEAWKIPLPDVKPYFYALFVDDQERIYVQRNMADIRVEDETQKEIDIFGKDGAFLYRSSLPKKAILIRNGYVYSYESGDFEIVKRSKIMNWNEMKTAANEERR